MPHGLSKKRPAKKIKRKKIFFVAVAAEPVMEGAHMGKIRLEKKIETEKTRTNFVQ